MQLSFNLVHPWSSSCVKIMFCAQFHPWTLSHRSHSQGIIITTDILSEGLCHIILTMVKVVEIMWQVMQRSQLHFSTETTHPKCRISHRRCLQLFCHPMVCFTL